MFSKNASDFHLLIQTYYVTINSLRNTPLRHTHFVRVFTNVSHFIPFTNTLNTATTLDSFNEPICCCSCSWIKLLYGFGCFFFVHKTKIKRIFLWVCHCCCFRWLFLFCFLIWLVLSLCITRHAENTFSTSYNICFFLLSFSSQTNGNMIKKNFVSTSTMNEKTTFQTFIDSLENELLSFGDCNKHFADFTIILYGICSIFFSFLSVIWQFLKQAFQFIDKIVVFSEIL